MPEKLLKVQEVAGMLGISRPTLYRLINSGGIESITFGGSRRIPESAVNDFIEAHRHPAVSGGAA